MLLFVGLMFSTSSDAASGPYDIPYGMSWKWDDTYGSKDYLMESGKTLVYDVYSNKYTSGGYKVVTENFGQGSRQYLNFQGWAVLFGHKRHTSTNHETYIVAQKVGSSTTKIYSTKKINISATEDLEYNNQGSGVWNECASWETNKSNSDCNMRYDNVGFNAYIPLEELFPDPSQGSEWKLYIVKEVDGHIVYTQLRLPFKFNNRSYMGGDIDLSSAINTNNLIMNSSGVLRRSEPRESQPSVVNDLGWDRYFDQDRTYTRIDQDESTTTVWYGVKSPHDGYAKKWANTAYFSFGGSQATIKFTPDDKPPVHIAHSLWSNPYTDGNDYWTRPNDTVYIRLKQRDIDSGNERQYLRLYGSSQDERAYHDFDYGYTYMNSMSGYNSSHVKINSLERKQNTSYGTINWSVTPKTHGHTYNVQYYYRDNAYNNIGYYNTGMRLRVDGYAPGHRDTYIWSHLYKNGNDYWTKPNDPVYIRFQQYDAYSGNKHQYLRLKRNGSVEVRSRHDFYDGSYDNNKQVYSSHVSIDQAYRDQNGNYGRVRWKVTPKTHGHTYDIQRYYQDNVNNKRGYVTEGQLRVDGVAPTASYSPHSKSWTNSNVTVNASVSDPHSGVKRFRYRIYSNGSWSSYSSWIYGTSKSFTLSAEGVNRIHIQTEDNVGNVGNRYSGHYYIDKTDPNANQSGITGHTYKNGSNYWVKPNQSLDVRLRGYDAHSRIYLSYIRLKGLDEARSQHNWNSSSTHLNNYDTSSHISVNSVSETYVSSDSRYKEVTFNVTPKTHGQYFNVYSLYRDNAYNWSDGYTWNNTGMTIRTDGVAPTHVSDNLYGARYVNGNDYWVKSNDTVQIRIRQQDPHSGNKYQYLRFYGSGVDARSQHSFNSSSTHNNHWMDSPHIIINTASREENTNYGKVLWSVTPKTHGHTYNVQYYFRDNVNNSRGYINTGDRLRVDDVAPSVAYRNKADTANFTSRDWTEDNIEVRLKYSDSHSGYKQSRYAWTLSPDTPSESEWSDWTTDSNYVVTQTEAEKWYLHTQMQDNVGNTRTVVNGMYKLNRLPVPGFEFDKGTYYVGDTMNVTSVAYDPDGHAITHHYEIIKPDGSIETFDTADFTYVIPDMVGNYTFKQTVTDSYGHSDSITAIVYVNDLTVMGRVLHTEEWKTKHDELGHDPSEFYSGEEFRLEADVTDHPIDYVKVDFEGYQDNGNLYKTTVNLSPETPTMQTGVLYDPQFAETGTTLKNGTIKFSFEVRYENGIIRRDTVYAEIIGSVFDYYKLHRRY